MKKITELFPYAERQLPGGNSEGFFRFNPSIHFDGKRWRCVVRSCNWKDYGRGVAKVVSRNIVFDLNDIDLEPLYSTVVRDLDETDRYPTSHGGFEDLRLFSSDGKLWALATTSQLRRETQQEMALLELDEEYQIVKVTPLRGEWSGVAQKNWTPFNDVSPPRYLYSIDGGICIPSDKALCLRHNMSETYSESDKSAGQTFYSKSPNASCVETREIGRRGVRKIGSGINWAPSGLRGGSQLIKVVGGVWLGVGHDVKVTVDRKNYWHRFYTVNDLGVKTGEGTNFKFGRGDIEFCAGLAWDGERLAMSFGVGDEEAWIGVTRLDEVMSDIRTLER